MIIGLSKSAVLCEGGIPPMPEEDEERYIEEVPSLTLDREGYTRKLFKFEDFKEAMKFVNDVARISEEEGHHPNISISYNRVQLELYTHAIKGLFENDFIMAAKIDNIKV